MQRRAHNQNEAKETDAFKFLSKQNSAVISTVDSKNRPSSAVIYYYVDDSFNLYFITKSSTRKYENITHNSAVSLCVYDESNRYTIQADGSAFEVTNEDEQFEIVDKLATIRKEDDHAWFPPVAQLKEGNIVAMKVQITGLRLADFKKFSSGKDSDLIENIELVH